MIRVAGVFAMCRRNFCVLKRMIWSAILGHVGEPFFYLLVFGYGFGHYIGDIHGQPFVAWLYPGIAVMSAAMSASMECTYSAFTRMERQKTYLAIASTPVSIEEVVLGEALWGAMMGLANAAATIAAVGLLFDVPMDPMRAAWVLSMAFLAGLLSSAIALLFTSYAEGYEAFAVYFTLILTPSAVLSGAYFPTEVFPSILRLAAAALPFTQPVVAARASGGDAWTAAGMTLLFLAPLLTLAVRRIARRVIV